jgi:hypothetical protein
MCGPPNPLTGVGCSFHITGDGAAAAGPGSVEAGGGVTNALGGAGSLSPPNWDAVGIYSCTGRLPAGHPRLADRRRSGPLRAVSTPRVPDPRRRSSGKYRAPLGPSPPREGSGARRRPGSEGKSLPNSRFGRVEAGYPLARDRSCSSTLALASRAKGRGLIDLGFLAVVHPFDQSIVPRVFAGSLCLRAPSAFAVHHTEGDAMGGLAQEQGSGSSVDKGFGFITPMNSGKGRVRAPQHDPGRRPQVACREGRQR